MHWTEVLSTSACAGLDATQDFFNTSESIWEHTLRRVCTCARVYAAKFAPCLWTRGCWSVKGTCCWRGVIFRDRRRDRSFVLSSFSSEVLEYTYYYVSVCESRSTKSRHTYTCRCVQSTHDIYSERWEEIWTNCAFPSDIYFFRGKKEKDMNCRDQALNASGRGY